nr:CapA family protein [Deinobacterium chartae]
MLCSARGGAGEPALTLVLGGDLMLGREGQLSAPGGPRALSALAPALQRADLALANLESPIASAPARTRGVDLRAPAQAARLLEQASFAALSVVNNHALDAGASGQRQTRSALRAIGVHPLDARPWLRTLRSTRLAFVALMDDPATPEAASRQAMVRAVQAARQAADRVVVSVHWGHEFGPVSGRQRRAAAALVSAGAELVFGHGPHVLQPVVRLEAGGRAGWVAYSLGNLVSDQPYPTSRLGTLLIARLERGHWQLAALPTRQTAQGVRPAEGEDALEALRRLGLPRAQWP